MKQQIAAIEQQLKKFSKEELIEKAYHLRVSTTDGTKTYPISWIRYDLAKKMAEAN